MRSMTATPTVASDNSTTDREEIGRRAFEDALRGFMQLWKEQGRVLEPDSPLWKYWPADEPSS